MIAAHYGKVEQKHIDNGVPSHRCKCPVALAIKEKFENSGCGVIDVDVDVYTIVVEFDNRDVSVYSTPHEIQTFLRDFDAGVEVEPFEYSAFPLE